LDDYNNDTEDGLHITSMGGTWMAFVFGFGGLRIANGKIVLNPFIPGNWKSYSFRIDFRGAHLHFKMENEKLSISNLSDGIVSVDVWGQSFSLQPNQMQEFLKSPDQKKMKVNEF
jgi:maltose phosphorylase